MSVKPLRISPDLTDFPGNREVDPAVDVLAAAGIDLENLNTHKILRNSGDMTFEDVVAGGPHTLSDLLNDGGNGSSQIVLDFSDNNSPYLQTSSNTYNVEAEFIFPGTTAVGVPTSIALLAGSDNGIEGASFKIFDKTNSLAIAEVTGLISLARVITDIGTLSNLSAGEAVWEIQAKRDTNGAKAQLSSFRMKF